MFQLKYFSSSLLIKFASPKIQCDRWNFSFSIQQYQLGLSPKNLQVRRHNILAEMFIWFHWLITAPDFCQQNFASAKLQYTRWKFFIFQYNHFSTDFWWTKLQVRNHNTTTKVNLCFNWKISTWVLLIKVESPKAQYARFNLSVSIKQ